MSVASAFIHPKPFGALRELALGATTICIPYVTTPTYLTGWVGAPVGPMTLEDAAAVYWNAEALSFNVGGVGSVVVTMNTVAPYEIPEPRGRVVTFPFFTDNGETGSTSYQHSCGLLFRDALADDYYFQVWARRTFFDGGGTMRWEVTNVPPAKIGLTATTSFPGTVFGYTVTFYRYAYNGGGAFSGSDVGEVEVLYYTY